MGALAGVSFLTIRRLLGRRQPDAGKEWLLEEGLLQAQKLAAIGRLGAGVAHEINNPLAIIRQRAKSRWHRLSSLCGSPVTTCRAGKRSASRLQF
ncbi:MAG: hypothetical protein AB1424_04490 [Thermodesulfobacteriota bacterium]